MAVAKKQTYWSVIWETVTTLLSGMNLTFRHFRQARFKRNNSYVDQLDYFVQSKGRVTLEYPEEKLAIPDVGRYQLHNEIEDCIVCDKCAKVCPVDCIDIEPVKSPEVFGQTSDGTSKRIYAARFDIDMGKCCFCGLCTTVCPTECLTMTPEYDFSTFDIQDHNFSFADMRADEIEAKKEAWVAHEKVKAASKTAAVDKEVGAKPGKVSFKPKFKIPAAKTTETESPKEEKSKPKFKPIIKIKKPGSGNADNKNKGGDDA